MQDDSGQIEKYNPHNAWSRMNQMVPVRSLRSLLTSSIDCGTQRMLEDDFMIPMVSHRKQETCCKPSDCRCDPGSSFAALFFIARLIAKFHRAHRTRHAKHNVASLGEPIRKMRTKSLFIRFWPRQQRMMIWYLAVSTRSVTRNSQRDSRKHRRQAAVFRFISNRFDHGKPAASSSPSDCLH